jgi:hypothetical protein
MSHVLRSLPGNIRSPGGRNEEARTNAGFKAGILALPQVSERV